MRTPVNIGRAVSLLAAMSAARMARSGYSAGSTNSVTVTCAAGSSAVSVSGVSWVIVTVFPYLAAEFRPVTNPLTLSATIQGETRHYPRYLAAGSVVESAGRLDRGKYFPKRGHNFGIIAGNFPCQRVGYVPFGPMRAANNGRVLAVRVERLTNTKGSTGPLRAAWVALVQRHQFVTLIVGHCLSFAFVLWHRYQCVKHCGPLRRSHGRRALLRDESGEFLCHAVKPRIRNCRVVDLGKGICGMAGANFSPTLGPIRG